MNKLLLLSSLVLLGACSALKPETKVVTQYVKVQCDLTQVCEDKDYTLETNRDLVLAFTDTKNELLQCKLHLESLQKCVKEANTILEDQ